MSNMFPGNNDDRYIRFGRLSHVPENVSRLGSAPFSYTKLVDIGFEWDSLSQHLRITNFQPASYYEDYLMTTSYSTKIQELQESQIKRLASLCGQDISQSKFIEIGCGDGSLLNYAAKEFNNAIGIEPSQPFAEIARTAGHTVISGYVTSEKLLLDEKFDAFASRQVFEHIPDPLDCLIGIKKMLKPGAVGLIEVPNGYRAFRDGRFFEFFPDHINYFSVNSLVALATSAGLNVISCIESFGGDYLELWVRYDVAHHNWLDAIKCERSKAVVSLLETLRRSASSKKNIGIWGCGAKTLTIVLQESLEFSNLIQCAIDSDPNKQGRFIPNTCIPIVSVDEAKKYNLDVICVLALSYRQEIASIIREKLSNCDSIVTLSDLGQVVHL